MALNRLALVPRFDFSVTKISSYLESNVVVMTSTPGSSGKKFECSTLLCLLQGFEKFVAHRCGDKKQHSNLAR